MAFADWSLVLFAILRIDLVGVVPMRSRAINSSEALISIACALFEHHSSPSCPRMLTPPISQLMRSIRPTTPPTLKPNKMLMEIQPATTLQSWVYRSLVIHSRDLTITKAATGATGEARFTCKARAFVALRVRLARVLREYTNFQGEYFAICLIPTCRIL